jgi:hypothetical protein
VLTIHVRSYDGVLVFIKILGKLRIIQQAVTERLSGIVDEVPACLKDEIIIAFRSDGDISLYRYSDVLQKRRRIDKVLP